MKNYLKHFSVLLILFAIALTGTLIFAGYRRSNPKQAPVRNNPECKTEERVFDYADLLSDDEENKLRMLIREKEQLCGIDIVLVVLNEDIGNSQKDLMNWADDFYDENAFGFNKPHGDGAVLVDNWHSYAGYNGDTWFSTSGKVEDAYSSGDIDSLLDDIFEVVNDSPYEGYRVYVEELADHMMPTPQKLRIPVPLIFVISLILAGLYFLINYLEKQAKDTTTPFTYVREGSQHEELHTDTFLTKTVHKVKIQNNSSGGGGHHISSGGFSHGGGGGHH